VLAGQVIHIGGSSSSNDGNYKIAKTGGVTLSTGRNTVVTFDDPLVDNTVDGFPYATFDLASGLVGAARPGFPWEAAWRPFSTPAATDDSGRWTLLSDMFRPNPRRPWPDSTS